jgi:adenylate cyclase
MMADLRQLVRSLSRKSLGHLRSGLPYALAAGALLALHASPINQTLNLLFYDLITGLRPAASARDQPISLIYIEEKDINQFGWPIDDALLCRALDQLLAGGASAVTLDLYRDKGVGSQQQCLRDRFQRDPRLVSIFNAAEGIGPIPQTPPLRQAFNDLVTDDDGVVRRDLVHVSGQSAATVGLPLRLVQVAYGDRSLPQRLESGALAIPWLDSESGGYQGLDAAGYQQMLPFRRPGSFQSWTLRDLLAGKGPKPGQVRGTAPSLRDLFPTPFSRFSNSNSAMLMPGVEIHAQRIASLLDHRAGRAPAKPRGVPAIQASPGWVKHLLDLLAAGLGIALGESFRSLRRSVAAVGLALAILLGTTVLLLLQSIWIGVSMPIASLSLMAVAAWVRRGGTSQEQRQQIQRLLGQTTSPAVAQALWAQRDQLLSDGRFEGRLLPVTVLFSDTCNFTAVSERLSPRLLLDWLNRGMAYFVPAITTRGGMVNKFTGDGLMAVFGAPISTSIEADALAAIEAALAIQVAVAELDDQLELEEQPRMQLRIGIHSGQVLAGSMGSSERLEYAVIGDTVNCASRLESLSKERQTNRCRVLVSSATRDLLPADLPLEWLSWGSLTVKGRQDPLLIWELLGRGEETEDLASANSAPALEQDRRSNAAQEPPGQGPGPQLPTSS